MSEWLLVIVSIVLYFGFAAGLAIALHELRPDSEWSLFFAVFWPLTISVALVGVLARKVTLWLVSQ